MNFCNVEKQGGSYLRRFPHKIDGPLPGRAGFLMIIAVMLVTTAFLSVACSNKVEGILRESGSDPEIAGNFNSTTGFVVIEMPGEVYNDYGPYAALESEELNGIGPLPAPSFREEKVVLQEQKAPEEKDPVKKDIKNTSEIKGMSEFGLYLEEIRPSNEEESLPEAEETSSDVDPEESDLVLEEQSVCWSEYQVGAGETLTDICSTESLTPEQIARANRLKNPNYLKEGQVLLIPKSPDHIDDTLAELERRKARELERLNRVDPVEVTEYRVQEGDSLWSISNKLSISIDTLFACNVMKDPDYLKPGTKLTIPNQDGLFHKVKKGDTLASIAEKYKTEVQRIHKANPDLDPDSLQVDMKIFVPGATPASSVFNLSDGRSSSRSQGFRWPVAGKINSPFGWRRHPITRKRNFHTGIDIRANTGRIIRAAKSGRVAYSGWMGGYGRVVVINHGNGYSTLYAHCSSLLVRKGHRVSSGQAIARVGSSGRTTGPHLHFEVRRNNKPINPLSVL
jgi:murein DD-endopeptidase MepM/ murein hydrolase activator NlpD